MHFLVPWLKDGATWLNADPKGSRTLRPRKQDCPESCRTINIYGSRASSACILWVLAFLCDSRM